MNSLLIMLRQNIMQNTIKSREVYIVDGARTPFIKAKGVPGPFSASDLAVEAASRLLQRQSFTPDQIQEVIIGCVAPSEDEANIARVIALRAGCGDKVPAWTVQRNCASGLQAIDSAVQSIASGRSDLILTGGCEAMSRTPLILNQDMTRWLGTLQQSKNATQKIKTLMQFRPHFLKPIVALLRGLTDPVVNLSMGQTAEELATLFSISRKEMDAYAAQSHQRVLQGQTQGVFDDVIPLFDKNGSVIERDDGVRTDATLERLAKLKPVFDKFGNITAGNSSQISDGAAMVILASEQAVQRYQLPVLAKIKDIQWAALDPRIMGLGPIHAMTPLLTRNSLSLADIPHIEINEAFAAQVIACVRAWEDPKYCQEKLGLAAPMGTIQNEQLNPFGGAIAIGHPVGASGARLVMQCAKRIKENNHHYAMASLCIGGGQGGAILIERV